jgi:SAM-dependent methyltransferase
MPFLRAAWRSTFGYQRRRRLAAFIVGDDASGGRPGSARAFGRRLIRAVTAADSSSWSRVVMNQETRRLVEGLGPGTLDALEVSGEGWRDFGFKSYRSVSYPGYDVCAGALPERFDIIIAEQVFEHLLWPYRAGKHVYEMLRPGGYFHMSTPFLYPVHDVPVDCSRWTETGLRYFLAECGFPPEACTTGSWGNRACVRQYLKRGVRYRRWLHSLRNEPAVPIVVWAVARKPA